MNNVLKILKRKQSFFRNDWENNFNHIKDTFNKSKILIIGGAGSIGSAVSKILFQLNPSKLHVIDISENNLAELVRDLRSSHGYMSGEFATFCIDSGSVEFDFFLKMNDCYDYIFNLSALKHVRSEKDPFTAMRLIKVNTLSAVDIIKKNPEAKKYFSVSSDKAVNPANLMGCSKRIMELLLMSQSNKTNIPFVSSRFANVAFSDGSLLNSFEFRLRKKQPLSVPNDISRYFITDEDAAKLCLMSVSFCEKNTLLTPKMIKETHPLSFPEIAERFLFANGFKMKECSTENEARNFFKNSQGNKDVWPVFVFKTDTSGEKELEEFNYKFEKIDGTKFENINIVNIENKVIDFEKDFRNDLDLLQRKTIIKIYDLINLVNKYVPEFKHIQKKKNLDEKM